MPIDLEYYFNEKALHNSWESLKKAKTDLLDNGKVKIPTGADGITFEDFQNNIHRNIREISLNVLKGTYHFYPLREVKIPKDRNDLSKGERPLRIARIRDMIVQKQLYNALYDTVEELFSIPALDNVSAAYRRHRSVHYAIRGINWFFHKEDYAFALDADIESFFDTIDHNLLMEKVDSLLGKNTIERQLIWRYIRTPYVPYEKYKHLSLQDREKFFMKHSPPIPRELIEGRKLGIPQGGVLSGMLANLYLHEFDHWVIENLGARFNIRYFRYADDFVILTKTESDAQAIALPVSDKLNLMALKMHPVGLGKTRIVNIPLNNLDFLGFRITADHVRVKPRNIQRFKNRFRESIQRLYSHTTEDKEKLLQEVIKYYVNSKLKGVADTCEICSLPRKHRNWISFFAPVITDIGQLHKLDVWIRRVLNGFMWDSFKVRIKGKNHLREYGMTSLVEEYRRYKDKKYCRCEKVEELTDEETES